ncbi:MAG: hypothetical protein SV775_18130 [Thermodesulfobacteriota bacterium]|nr:hypothetical protein [Thermodesulfobacteriota bacterium]
MIIFFFHRYNDLDHIAPLVYKMAQNNSNQTAEILSAVMEQSVLEINKTIREITNSNLTPEEKLKDALNNHLGYLTEYIDSVTIFLREFRYLPPKNKEIYIKGRKLYESLFEKIVCELQEKGHFRGLNTKIVTFGILGMCNWLIVWHKDSGPGHLGPRQIADIFYRLLMTG